MSIDDFRADIQRGKQASSRCYSLCESALQPGQLPQRLACGQERTKKGKKRTCVKMIGLCPPPREGKQGCNQKTRHQFSCWGGHRTCIRALDEMCLATANDLTNAIFFGRFLIGNLDDLDPIQTFHDGCRQRRCFRHGALRGTACCLQIAAHDRADQRSGNQHGYCHHPILLEHDKDR